MDLNLGLSLVILFVHSRRTAFHIVILIESINQSTPQTPIRNDDLHSHELDFFLSFLFSQSSHQISAKIRHTEIEIINRRVQTCVHLS
jgi:hypothetical protein